MLLIVITIVVRKALSLINISIRRLRRTSFAQNWRLKGSSTRCRLRNCVYVGDAERDVQAGKAAGMKTIVALFGYIAESDKPAEWGADAMINKPIELLSLL